MNNTICLAPSKSWNPYSKEDDDKLQVCCEIADTAQYWYNIAWDVEDGSTYEYTYIVGMYNKTAMYEVFENTCLIWVFEIINIRRIFKQTIKLGHWSVSK